jgi:hypothetical protein
MAIIGQRHHAEQHHEQHGKDLFGEAARRLLALAFQAPGEQRHEGGVEGALAEQAPEQVGKAERHHEGVGDRPGAQHRGHEHVAHESEHPARHGEPADGGS